MVAIFLCLAVRCEWIEDSKSTRSRFKSAFFRFSKVVSHFQLEVPASCPGSERPSMAWYAYCITEQQTLANGTRARRPFLMEGIQGVNDAPVLSYPSGEFAVIVSEYDRSDAKLEEKHVLEHARVVSVCFRTGTVLPFRFGTTFESDEALRQAVRSNRRAFGQSVAKLRGKA